MRHKRLAGIGWDDDHVARWNPWRRRAIGTADLSARKRWSGRAQRDRDWISDGQVKTDWWSTRDDGDLERH